jgi:hypothetical protein
LLSEFSNLLAWEDRVRALGHGRPTSMTANEALAIARAATSETGTQSDPGDPQGLTPGWQVAVAPDDVGGGPPVVGEIVDVSAEQLAIRRRDERVGEVVVHFPRVGYRVSRCSPGGE